MRVTLEKPDLVSILSKALGYELADEDVSVQSDPFEVQIRKVNVSELAKSKIGSKNREEERAESFDTDGNVLEEPKDTVLTMEEILNVNNSLKNKATYQPSALSHSVRRPLGDLESLDPPPVMDVEMDALARFAKRSDNG